MENSIVYYLENTKKWFVLSLTFSLSVSLSHREQSGRQRWTDGFGGGLRGRLRTYHIINVIPTSILEKKNHTHQPLLSALRWI